MLRFFLVFCLVQLSLFSLELTQAAQNTLVLPFTAFIAKISAILIQMLDPQVLAQGTIIYNPLTGFGVAIRAGCNGVEAVIILAAAMFAFPRAAWQQRFVGFAIGAITIQGLNLIRIISLFYLGQWHRPAFEWAHLYVWEVLIMLDVLVVFLLWIHYIDKKSV